MSIDFSKLNNKNIAFLGLGLENFALAKFILFQKIKCAITVHDARGQAKLGEKFRVLASKNLTWKLGSDANKDLDGYDILFRSPGWPLFDPEIAKAKKFGVMISSPMKLFFELCPTKNIIGVTGTKGKGTTASLIFHILKTARKRAWLAGNIGVAPFEFIGRIKKNDWVVLELSSFQLEDMETGPRIAVMTNFYPEHLSPADPLNPNYHRRIADYWRAKTNILKWQKRGDWGVLNRKMGARSKKMGARSKILFFTKSDLASKLIGEHNKENIAAAFTAAKRAGASEKIIAKAVRSFRGLPHRLELVAKSRGISYYNDSFATTPESAITALKSFGTGIILLAGGAEKKSDFKILANEIKKRVKAVVLLKGGATPRLKQELIKIKYPARLVRTAESMRQAVGVARHFATTGDVVLLSPACASFGMFKNYKDRGSQFKKEARRK